MAEKIEFPFEPNERVKAAFRNEVARKEALDAMTKALLEAATQVSNPWAIVREEYPELRKEVKRATINYNFFTQMLDIREK